MSLVERHIAPPGKFIMLVEGVAFGPFETREAAVQQADLWAVAHVYDDTGSVVYSVESIP